MMAQDYYSQGRQIMYEEPPPSYPFTNPDTLAQIINRRDPVEEMVDSLKGIRRDKTGRIVFQAKRPLLNEYGIEAMITVLKSVLSQNIILSKLDMEEIKSMTDIIGESIIYDLELNYKKYGVIDTSQMDKVASVVIVSVYSSLKSAVGGFTGGLISPMYRRLENVRPEGQKQAFFPSFGGGK